MKDILYLTNACCENAHGHWAYFQQFGIHYSGYNPATGKLEDTTIDGDLPPGTEFYPLTRNEAQYVREKTKDILTGYTVLYRGGKYLAPTLEICFEPDGLSRHEAQIVIDLVAEGAGKVLTSIGGIALTEYAGTGGDFMDRHVLLALIPFHFALFKKPDEYFKFLDVVFRVWTDYVKKICDEAEAVI